MNRTDRLLEVWRLPWVPAAAAVLAFAAVTLATALVAWPRIHIGFAAYDDEGYMLVALGSFLDHGSLYDSVFSQYGPFYYEFWGGVFSLFGLAADHDSARLVVFVVWVVSSLTFGLATWRMTRSAALGLATQMLVFGGLISLVNEPMHPGGIIVLLLAAIVAISCFVRAGASPYAMATLGGAVAALILVKINVGAFALVAVALACAVSYPVLTERRWPRPLVEFGFVAVALLPAVSKAGEAWARHYAVHVLVAALAVVIALRAREARRRPSEELWWLVGGLLAVGLVVCLAIVGAGTSPAGLVEGIVEQPLRQSDAFSIPLGLSDDTYLLDLLGLAGAGAWWYVARRRDAPPSTAWVTIISVLSIAVGVTMALAAIGRSPLFDQVLTPGHQLGMLGFAWVALLAPPGYRDDATSFARLLLPPLAVLQALHAFPVAGSQVLWSAFLLIPVGALCVANGVRGLAASIDGPVERRALAALGTVVAAIVFVALVNLQLREPLHEARAVYDASTPIDLPGARDVRVSPEEAETYRAVVAAIESNCATFVMLPGMNSFYVWTGIDPPTGSNATGWPTLFDDARQRRVIDEIDQIDGLCLLRNTPQAEAWGAVEGPLVEYLGHGFRPLETIGVYELLKRNGAGA